MGAILAGLNVDERALARNLDIYGPFAATERVLMAAVKRGGDRQELHELIRAQAMRAWNSLRDGEANPLAANLAREPGLTKYLPQDEIQALMAYHAHLGDAPQRTLALAETILNTIPKS
jgi:adenylosuccinate lyase